MTVSRKINELYVSKQIVLSIPYRGKIRKISYIVCAVSGTAMQISLSLKSKKYPCEIPNMAKIDMELNNEFPTKKQMSILKKKFNEQRNTKQ